MSAPGILFPVPRIGILPSASMKAFFWAPGGTTKQNTYSDSDLAIGHLNLNPLVADAAGLFPAVYLDPTLGYKIALYPSTEVNDPPTGTAYLTQDNAYLPSAHLPQVLSKTGNYTVSTADGVDILIEADATSGSFTVSLFTAVGNTGKRITVKKIDSSANTVTVDPNGTQTIDGALTRVLSTQYEGVTVESDGSNWVVVAIGRSMPVILSKTTTYALAVTDGDDVLVLCDATAGAMSVTLYAVAGNAKRRVTVKKTDTSVNAVTIDPNASETIDGATTLILAGQYDYASLECDGTTWQLVGSTPILFTFLPVLGGSGGTSGQTYATQAGFGLKNGRDIKVQGRIVLSAKGTITTDVQLQGFPFTSLVTTNARYSGVIGEFESFNTSYVGLALDGQPNATAMELYGLTAASSGNAKLATANLTNNTGLTFSASYIGK